MLKENAFLQQHGWVGRSRRTDDPVTCNGGMCSLTATFKDIFLKYFDYLDYCDYGNLTNYFGYLN